MMVLNNNERSTIMVSINYIATEQRINKRGQVVKYRHIPNVLAGFECLPTFTGFNQYRLGHHIPGSNDIPLRISNGVGPGQVDLRSFSNIFKQTGAGFTATASIIRAVGTKKYAVNLPALMTDSLQHFIVNTAQRIQIKQSTGNTGLVAGNNNAMTIAI